MSDLFYRIFTEDVPLLDVRAPIEFKEGAFPNATNCPLLDDEQRHKIGIHYKNAGKNAAIEMGNEFISGAIKEQRLRTWKNYIATHNNAYLYCFRGGLRSKTTQQWLRQNGIHIALIEGGYKALRRYLIEQLNRRVEESDLMILGGQTGTGKTLLLNKLNYSIDLEGLANHRGSSFGRMVDSQPNQIDFENALSIALLKMHKRNIHTILLEDEGFLIGRIALPKILHEKMKNVPLVLLEEAFEKRLELIFNDYIVFNYQKFKERYGEDGLTHFKQYLYASLERIKKRLGGLRYHKIRQIMQYAIETQEQKNETSMHKEWIQYLMKEYYDPMYRYQLDKKQSRIIYRGGKDDVLQWLQCK